MRGRRFDSQRVILRNSGLGSSTNPVTGLDVLEKRMGHRVVLRYGDALASLPPSQLLWLALAAVLLLAVGVGDARGEGPPPISREALALAARDHDPDEKKGQQGALPGVDVEERIGSYLPLDLVFTDESGAPVRLGDVFGDDKPTLLIPAYYRCPVLCGILLKGVTTTVKNLGWVPGENFRLVTISIDPNDTPTTAGKKKESVLGLLENPEAGDSWLFLTGEQAAIDALTDALGYRYVYDEKTNQYVHPAVSVAIGPGGLVSRYLYGVELRPFDMRMALLEAGEGKVGTALERFILSCFRYDPVSQKYVSWVFRFIRVGAFGIAMGVGLLLSRLWRRERKGAARE